jgi:hypothetical protein
MEGIIGKNVNFIYAIFFISPKRSTCDSHGEVILAYMREENNGNIQTETGGFLQSQRKNTDHFRCYWSGIITGDNRIYDDRKWG